MANKNKPSNSETAEKKLELLEKFKKRFLKMVDGTDFAIIEHAIFTEELNDAIVNCVAISVDNDIHIPAETRMQILTLLHDDEEHLKEIHYYYTYYQNKQEDIFSTFF